MWHMRQTAIAVSTFAESQLIANAGLAAEQAAGLTLSQIAAAKFNRDTGSGDGRRLVVGRGDVTVISRSVGASYGSSLPTPALSPEKARGLTLSEIAAVKFNRDPDDDDQLRVVRGGRVIAISRSVGSGAHSQLAANAGLTPEGGAAWPLNEIAAAKFARESDDN